MKIKKTITGRYRRLNMRTRGKNVGACICCSTTVNWRSVSNMCWRCEMDRIKTRRPLHLDRDVLMSLTGAVK